MLFSLCLLQFCGVCLWIVSLKTRNVNIVDVFWGMGFALVAGFTAIGVARGWFASAKPIDPANLSDSIGLATPQLTVLGMVLIWGSRLSCYLAWRSWGKAEDHRYAAMRKYWGDRFARRSLVTVFGLQALLIWFISLPIQLGLSGQAAEWPAMIIGCSLWLIGFSFESIGDWQMYRFKSDLGNHGNVMNRGLWRYTRHPNYFGDFLVWWGLYIATAQAGSWWWTILAPSLMSFLLIRVSGVSLLESSLRQRILGYEQYVRTTSSFLPWPPKS